MVLECYLKSNDMRTYIILGMHRSATSFLAKCLKLGGVNIGKDLLGPAKGNPEGHFENIDFLNLDDEMLFKAGGNWLYPPSEEAIHKSAEQLKDKIKETIKRNQDEMWGWKDPRTALTIQEYLPYLDDDVYLVAVFRKPKKVAESLNKRDGIPIERGIELAQKYNKRIIEAIKKFLYDN